MPLSARMMWLIGAGGASLIALTISAQIYLSMLDHGHSFARMFAWQLCSWSVWALATPTVLRLGARLSERSTQSVSGPVAGTGLLVIAATSSSRHSRRSDSSHTPRWRRSDSADR